MDNYARLKEITELDSYLTEKNELLRNVINNVGWTEETLHEEVINYYNFLSPNLTIELFMLHYFLQG